MLRFLYRHNLHMILALSTNIDLKTLISLSKEIFMGCARQKRNRQFMLQIHKYYKFPQQTLKTLHCKNALQMIVLKS